MLDGKPVEACALAGATGHLELNISIRDNPEADLVFADHYALQTALSFDMERCNNLKADGATIASAGKNKSVSFIKLANSDADYSLSMDVDQFQMDGIQISGILLSIDMDIPDTDTLTDGLTELQSGIGELNSGAEGLSEGAGDLKDGIDALCNGLYDMQSGMDSLKSGLGKLAGGNSNLNAGSQQIYNALTTIQSKLTQFNIDATLLSQLSENSANILLGIGQLSGGLDSLKESFTTADEGIGVLSGGIYTGLQQADTETIEELTLQLTALYADPVTNADEIQRLTWLIGLLTANRDLLAGLETGISGDGTAANPGLAAGAETLKELYGQFDTAIQSLTSMLGEMNTGLAQLKGGMEELISSFTAIQRGYQGLYRRSG